MMLATWSRRTVVSALTATSAEPSKPVRNATISSDDDATGESYDVWQRKFGSPRRNSGSSKPDSAGWLIRHRRLNGEPLVVSRVKDRILPPERFQRCCSHHSRSRCSFLVAA